MDAIALGIQPLTIASERTELATREGTHFIDLTEWIAGRVRRTGIEDGIALVRVLHTTAAIVVNENEPLLLEDFKALLERLAPAHVPYAHDDLARRRGSLLPEERSNGHSHARALLLGDSRQLEVAEGRVVLGRWQSILLVELDGPRTRTVTLTVIGHRR
jgi:secondary thiamine-phosphate synthase enzyme